MILFLRLFGTCLKRHDMGPRCFFLLIQTLPTFWATRISILIFMCFFPTTLVDGFSKLWLRGKGILGVETLIPGISVPSAGAQPVPVVKK